MPTRKTDAILVAATGATPGSGMYRFSMEMKNCCAKRIHWHATGAIILHRCAIEGPLLFLHLKQLSKVMFCRVCGFRVKVWES